MKNEFISKVRFVLITCILIPVSFLLLVEFTLRITDYGYPSGFFIKERINGQEFYVNNYKFSWRFFPKAMARISSSIVVPVKKDKDAIRIFVFGESAAQGDPEPSFSFSRFLRAMLEKKYPGKKIEIYNTAVTAINSNVILPIVNDCLSLEPDLFIVYMGNNEVIGPYGLSSALTPFFSNYGVIKMQVWLSKTKIGQMIRELSAKETDLQQWKGMELFIKNKISHDSPDLEKIYNHFDKNLYEICKLATESGTKVVLSTVITNERDCPPFLSVHNPDLSKGNLDQWQKIYNAGIGLDSTGQYKLALEQYEKAIALDSEYAELNFRIGRCYLSLNQYEKAKKFFSKARDYDVLRFRADTRINDIIRKTAGAMADRNIYLADAEKVAHTESKFGIPGSDILYEHVHLNFNGNYLLANSVLPQTEKALGLNSSLGVLNLEDCKTRLAYTEYDEKNIEESNLLRLSAAPFTNQYTNKLDVKALQNKIREIENGFDSVSTIKMDNIYLAAIKTHPMDWFLHTNYLNFSFNFNRYADADRESAIVYNLLPYEYSSNLNRGITLRGLKKYKESEAFYLRAISINPFFSEAYRSLSLLYTEMGLFYKVPYYLKKAHSSKNEIAAFYNSAGLIYAKRNKMDSAEVYLNKAIKLRPDFKEAHRNLGKVLELKRRKISPSAVAVVNEIYNRGNMLFKQGNYLEALLNYEKAIKLNSSYPKAHNNAGITCIQLQRYDEAMQHFKEAIKIDPNFIEAYPNIAMLHSNRQRHKEAIEILNKAIKIKADPKFYRMMAEEYMKIGDKASADKCLEQERSLLKLVPQ
jgi:tetratricopeptide (TPR) repeat protein